MHTADPTVATAPSPFCRAGGAMAQRMRDFAWENTPVGPVDRWPRSLKSLVMTLLECQLPMYIAWGPQFTQFYNDAYRPILGAKDASALGNSAPVTWSEIWSTIGPMWAQAMEGKPIGFDDFKLTIERFGYPEDCYFNFSYSAVRDDEGRAAGVLVTFAETTERVHSEKRLRLLDELSQNTRAHSEPAEVMRSTSALLGQYLGVNRCAYARVLADEDTFDLIGDYNEGVSSIVGRYRFTDFGAEVLRLMRANRAYVNPNVDEHPLTAGTDLSAYRRTQIQAVICVPLHKDGKLVAAMAVHQSVPRTWTHEEIELVETVVDRCWDALERLRAEAALREEARCLELLNRTGSDLSGELELQALLQRATDAATELTGAKFGAFFYNGVDSHGEAYLLYTLSGAPRQAFEALGHPRPTAVFGPTFRGEPPIRVNDVLADPRYGQWGPHFGMPEGHLPVRSYLAVPVIGRSGEVIGALMFGHPETDIFSERSERLAVGIASQAAIAIDNARLYSRAQNDAEERRRLLESERAARGVAERLSTVKDEFLATLSHELRTPLSAITGWVHILKRRLPTSDPQLLRGIEVIERSTQLQVQLIDDLLDMSRISAGKLSLDLQPLAPVSFVQQAVDVIQPSAEARGVKILTTLDAVGCVLGDARRLQQVVWNLVSNAVKFTPRGGAGQRGSHGGIEHPLQRPPLLLSRISIRPPGRRACVCATGASTRPARFGGRRGAGRRSHRRAGVPGNFRSARDGGAGRVVRGGPVCLPGLSLRSSARCPCLRPAGQGTRQHLTPSARSPQPGRAGEGGVSARACFTSLSSSHSRDSTRKYASRYFSWRPAACHAVLSPSALDKRYLTDAICCSVVMRTPWSAGVVAVRSGVCTDRRPLSRRRHTAGFSVSLDEGMFTSALLIRCASQPALASRVAHALATADIRSGACEPGTRAQPPFSTNSPCDHVLICLNAERLAETSPPCRNFSTHTGARAAITALSARMFAAVSAPALVAHPAHVKPAMTVATAPVAAPSSAGLICMEIFMTVLQLPQRRRPSAGDPAA